MPQFEYVLQFELGILVYTICFVPLSYDMF